MRKKYRGQTAAIVITAAILSLAWILMSGEAKKTTSEPTVSASVFPLYDIVRQIAGSELKVSLLLPPGGSPHTFEPTPKTIRAVNDSAAVYLIGHGVDSWADSLAAGAGTPTITVDTNISLIRTEDDSKDREEEGEDGHHHEDGADPHYWLNIKNAKLIAANVAEDLSRRFPESADILSANLEKYLQELDRTDLRIREILQQTGNRQLVTLHDAWYYFAEEYDLTVVGSFVPSPGREPTPQWLTELSFAVDLAGSKALFSEPQISTETLEPFLADHQLRIAVLDPLGGADGNDSYTQMMLNNAQTIAENQ